MHSISTLDLSEKINMEMQLNGGNEIIVWRTRGFWQAVSAVNSSFHLMFTWIQCTVRCTHCGQNERWSDAVPWTSQQRSHSNSKCVVLDLRDTPSFPDSLWLSVACTAGCKMSWCKRRQGLLIIAGCIRVWSARLISCGRTAEDQNFVISSSHLLCEHLLILLSWHL